MDLPCADGLLGAWVRHASRRRPVEPLANLDLAAVHRVLLVLTTGLGDAVLSTPVFQAVRRALPQARIALFVRGAWAPLFAAEGDLDEVIPYPGKWRRFFATLGRLRGFAPDLTLVLHGNDPDILPLAYLAGSRHIVRVPTAGTRYGRLLSNITREQDRTTVAGLHYIDNRLRVLDSVGIPAARRTPVIRCDDARRAAARAWVAGRLGERPYVVVHPHAADTYKTWPAEQARAFLATALERRPELGFVLTGGSREAPAAAALAAGLPADRIAVAAGAFDIAGTAALLAGARAVIAPDTGLLHLAAALDVPTIGLYSPTQPSLVGPRAEMASVVALTQPLTCDPCLEKRCPYKPALCMAQFGAAEVLAALDRVAGNP